MLMWSFVERGKTYAQIICTLIAYTK
jgi:hypothetical protein